MPPPRPAPSEAAASAIRQRGASKVRMCFAKGLARPGGPGGETGADRHSSRGEAGTERLRITKTPFPVAPRRAATYPGRITVGSKAQMRSFEDPLRRFHGCHERCNKGITADPFN